MIATRLLRNAVQEGLAYLRTIPDIKEAEVFAASNGTLIARLNYTSNIPSNGVEEPKSTESYGIGVRIAVGTPDGIKTGFGGEPSDISLTGLKRALEKARKGAVNDPEFVSLPRPTGERRTLRSNHDPKLMQMRDGRLVDVGWQVVERALADFQSSEELLIAAGSPDGVRRLGLIVGGDVVVLQERMAVGSYHFPRVLSDESTLIMSFATAMVERQFAKGSGWSVGARLDEFGGEAGSEAAGNTLRSMNGQRVGDGRYRVVLGPQPVADLLNNLILPGVNLGLFYAAASPFLGKLGKPIAWEGLNMYDHGALPGYAGSKGLTDEGIPTGRTDLIKNGVLVGLLANYYETQRMLQDPKAREKLGADPKECASAIVPRNGFRTGRGGGRHFDMLPAITPTNIIIEGSVTRPSAELVRMIGDGLYIGRIWYTYPINGIAAGDFTCTVVGDSYIIKNGRIAAPLKPNTIRLNDSIHNVLKGVLAVGDKRRGTLVWAADQVMYVPEIAVEGVQAKEIAGYMEGL